jgi:hypothetical protein
VCEGSTIESPTYPEGVYTPDPNIESAGVISGDPEVGNTLTFAPGTISGTAPITATYNWIRYIPGGGSVIVGTGLSYVVQLADISHRLIVQTVAAGPTQTVATQTVPFGPCYSASPIITDPGTISIQGSTDPAYCPTPGDILEYSGATVSYSGTYTTYVTWAHATNPEEVWQVGGSTFVIPDTAVGDSVVVKVVVFAVGAPNSAQDETNAIAVCGYLNVVVPSKISEYYPVYVGQGLTGEPAIFESYGQPTVTYGFFDVTDPLNPIAITPPKTLYYIVKPEDFGKLITFTTSASIGILTATSDSSALGPVEGYLNVVTPPSVSYTADIVTPGTILTGRPGIFDGIPPVTSVTSGFYRNTGTYIAPNWVLIGSNPTYAVQQADVGFDVAYGSTAISPLYPSGVFSVSNPVRPVSSFVFVSTGGYTNLTRPGQTPNVGDTLQQVYPSSFPQNTKNGGSVPLVGELTFTTTGSTSTSEADTFTVPDSFYGRTFYQVFTALYFGNAYTQTTDTSVVGGRRPTIFVPGSITSDNPSFPFTPGTNAIFTKPTITAGVPAAYTDTWTWYLRSIGGTRTPIQNGGLVLNIPVSFSGKTLEVDYTVSNVVGSSSASYAAPVPVPPPTLVFTFIGQLSGSKNFAGTNGDLTVSYTNAVATDGTGDPITITKAFWVTDSIGNKIYPATITGTGVQTVTVTDSLSPYQQQEMTAPPGNPKQIPTPFVNRFLSIEWLAVNPKTGARATVMSTPFGSLTQTGQFFGGLTPPAIVVRDGPSSIQYTCTLTMPTFNNGGYVDVSTIKVFVQSSFGTTFQISSGSLTFVINRDSFNNDFVYMSATIRSVAGGLEISEYSAIINL